MTWVYADTGTPEKTAMSAWVTVPTVPGVDEFSPADFAALTDAALRR